MSNQATGISAPDGMDLESFCPDIDAGCASQAIAIASSPAFEGSRVRLMPDAHSGKAAVVGFTATIGECVVPAVVGGDIGCGVLACKLKKPKKGLDFTKLDKAIRAKIAYGVGSIQASQVAEFDFGQLKCWDALPGKHLIPRSLGSLGAGNHFIEIDESDDGLWLVIHSGSRSLGTQVAAYYQGLAFESTAAAMPDVPYYLAWLEGRLKDDYMHDMQVACRFAEANRAVMAKLVTKACGLKIAGTIESTHNYIDVESSILRKGAVSARSGEDIVLPLNMAVGCAFARGLGNREWNFSAPHGCGRDKTRKQARESISMGDYRKSMDGVWSSCISSETVDESPDAYKDPASVLEAATPSIEVTGFARALYNFKAPSGD